MSVMSQMVRMRWGTAFVHAHHLYLTKCISVPRRCWGISVSHYTFRRSHFSSPLQLEEIMLSSLFKCHSSGSITGICALLLIHQPWCMSSFFGNCSNAMQDLGINIDCCAYRCKICKTRMRMILLLKKIAGEKRIGEWTDSLVNHIKPYRGSERRSILYVISIVSNRPTEVDINALLRMTSMLFVAQNTQILCQKVVWLRQVYALSRLNYRTLMRMLHNPQAGMTPEEKPSKEPALVFGFLVCLSKSTLPPTLPLPESNFEHNAFKMWM